ncbi:unnamed protein product [Vitrella brassicaformis CCMP3155]|uniref:Protein kinase domain-containing protein n=1 Tax=Vitrella brassicaformis (strain CCMP3155) TaxID=1169540 RepID=A0A0G4G1T9_VITBC|nr:unnamed protein product [Vitrella brassicaformis CCMP3155]|eukprot:CEM21700.1 unnamed protein product [Vitrella brassicaformis CCMP3155]
MQPGRPSDSGRGRGDAEGSAATTGATRPPRYILKQLLGSGTFGKCYVATGTSTNELVAIKKRPKWGGGVSREQVMLELVKGLPHCVQMEGVVYTHSPRQILTQHIVMQCVPSTLGQLIRRHRAERRPLPSDLIRSIARQLVAALHALHQQNIAHRDIKPENILFDPKTRDIFICDLGCAKSLSDSPHHMPYICSRPYRAPELLFGSMTYNESVDVWSTGCILAEMLLLSPLFVGRKPPQPQHDNKDNNDNKDNKERDDGRHKRKRNRMEGPQAGDDEPYQILRICQVLGTPTRAETEELTASAGELIKSLELPAVFASERLAATDLRRVLAPLVPPGEEGLLDPIHRCVK